MSQDAARDYLRAMLRAAVSFARHRLPADRAEEILHELLLDVLHEEKP